jgi:hypothetical protein
MVLKLDRFHLPVKTKQNRAIITKIWKKSPKAMKTED